MSMDLSVLSGEQLLMMSIMGVIDQDAADAELDRRALLSSPGLEETIELLLREASCGGRCLRPARKRLDHAA